MARLKYYNPDTGAWEYADAAFGGGLTANGGRALKGKRLSILGDSIDTYEGYIPDGYESYYDAGNLESVEDTWWKKVIRATGMELCVNNSYSGTRVAVTGWLGDYAGCLASRNKALHDGEKIPDIIIVRMGCNDFNNEIAVGDYGASDGLNFDTGKFSDAYAQTLYNITTAYPTSKVYCCTCPASEKNTPTEGSEVNGNGLAFYEFNDLIRKLARMFHCEVIDLESCGITHENLACYMEDGIQHPNAYGHSLMANKVIETIDPANATRYAGLAPTFVEEQVVPVTGVTLNQTGISLEQGKTLTLTAAVSPGNATDKTVKWSTSGTTVATVENGLVTAVGEGKCVITATTNDGGYTASCTVSVTAAASADSQVTSITSTPGQYIDTEYVPTANTRMEMDWARVSNATQSCLFGCRHLGIKSANAVAGFLFSNFGSTWSTFAYEEPGVRSVMGVKMNYVYKNGEQVFTNPNGNVNTPPTRSILIFGCNGWGDSDELSTFGGSYTLYGFKIYESDQLVKNFVPWVDANGKACLKETIGGTFHYDKTGGTFDYT